MLIFMSRYQVHICHIQNIVTDDCIVIHFQSKSEMKIMVKMIELEGTWMTKADS